MVSTPKLDSLLPSGDMLERAAKLIAGVVAMAYVTGFLIVNLHLSRYGIAQVELFKPKVIASGASFIVIALLGWAIGVATIEASRTVLPKDDSGQQRVRWEAFLSYLPFVTDAGAFAVGAVIFDRDLRSANFLGILATTAGSVLAFGAFYWAVKKRPVRWAPIVIITP